MKKMLATLIVLCMLLVSCNIGGGIIIEPPEDDVQDKVAGIILSLPAMTENDVEDLQEIVIYNNGEEIKHYYADMLRNLITVASSKAIEDELVNPELEVPLDEGEYNLSVKGIGYHGNGFELDPTRVKVNHGENPIKYICKPDKTSYVYLDCDAFIPYWLNDFVSVTVQGEYFSSRTVLNIWNGKSDCLKNYETETVTIKAELTEEAKALGYSLEYPETVELKKEHASHVRIVVKNENFMDPAGGTKITLSFNRDGIYSFFNSFSSWFPMESVDKDNDAERNANSYGFVFSYIPESYEKEIYVPNGLDYGYQSSSWNCVTKAAERHTISKSEDNTRWSISTTSQRGQSAWMNVTVDPLPQELIDGLRDLRLYYGSSSIGGWAEKYIPTDFSSVYPRTLEMPVTPGEFEFSSRLTPKEGVTLHYDLVPEVKSMKTKGGFEYNIRFLVVDTETGESVQVPEAGPTDGPSDDPLDNPSTPGPMGDGKALINVFIDPLPQSLIDNLTDLRLWYGEQSLGGWSEEYIPRNFSADCPTFLPLMEVNVGEEDVWAELRMKEAMIYNLVCDAKVLKTEAGEVYSIRFQVFDRTIKNTVDTMSGSSKAWLYMVTDPLPQDLLNSLQNFRFRCGTTSIGGLSGEYILDNMLPEKKYEALGGVEPGTYSISASLMPKDGETLRYTLVPDQDELSVEAGKLYTVKFRVLENE